MVDLGLTGRRVESVLIERSVVLGLSDSRCVLVSSPLVLTLDCSRFTLVPDTDSDEALQPLHCLIDRFVLDARCNESGTLHIVFSADAALTVERDPNYEAWNVSGPGGALVVCLPSGKLSVWGRDT